MSRTTGHHPGIGAGPAFLTYATDQPACRDEPPDQFFPSPSGPAEPALAICRRCPLLTPCRDWALGQRTWLHGIWGGTTQAQRATP